MLFCLFFSKHLKKCIKAIFTSIFKTALAVIPTLSLLLFFVATLLLSRNPTLTRLTRSITPDAQTSSTGLNAQGTGKCGEGPLFVPIIYFNCNLYCPPKITVSLLRATVNVADSEGVGVRMLLSLIIS